MKLLEGESLVPNLRVASWEFGVASESHTRSSTEAQEQLGLFTASPHPAVERLRAVDPNGLTPLQALTLLAELVQDAKRS